MTPVSKALAACPDLVLIDGSDLTPFRQANHEIMQVIRAWLSNCIARVCATLGTPIFDCPCQKLGFDEVFIDLTRLVQHEITAGGKPWSFDGHVFGRTDDDAVRRTLMVASQLVADLRRKITETTQLTLCGGVSQNKLLAKLAVNMNKPHDQTTFLPGEAAQYVAGLCPRDLPGIGFATEQKLKEWATKHPTINNLSTSRDVIKTFGGSPKAQAMLASVVGNRDQARKILSLCSGQDDSPVVDSGAAFKSITSMDSFRKCSTLDDVRARVRERVVDLVSRLRRDWEINKRRPKTLTVGYRFRGNGFHGATRATHMPTRVLSVCSSRGNSLNVKNIAIDALKTATLTVLEEHAGVSAQASFDLTWISIGASNFTDLPDSNSSSPRPISSFFTKPPQSKQQSTNREKRLAPSRPIAKSSGNRSETACPVCKRVIKGGMLLITRHVDNCLSRGAGRHRRTDSGRTQVGTKRVDSFFSK